MSLQKLLIRYILNPMAGIMSGFSEKTKNSLFVFAGSGIILQTFLKEMRITNYRFLIFFVIDCALLGIMILCALGERIRPVRFRWALMIPWLGTGVFMLQAGIRLNMDYLPEAMLFLAAYPVLFICWNNADRTRILHLLIWLCRIAALVFFGGNLLLAKISPSRYSGIFCNPNGAAFVLATVSVFLLAHVITAMRFDWKWGLDVLLLGASLTLNYYTNSRSGMLAVLAASAVGIVMYLVTHPKKARLRCAAAILAVTIVTAAMIPGLLHLFELRQKLNLPYLNPLNGEFYTLQETEEKKPPKIDTSGFDKVTTQKGDYHGQTADEFSTGRLSVWKFYVDRLNWFGHAETPIAYIELLHKDIASTHMTILQYGYESGIFAGICYLIVNIGSGLAAIWFAWRNRDERYACLPLMAIVSYGAMSMLSSCGVSFWYLTTFCYNMVLFPLMAFLPANEQTGSTAGQGTGE